MRIFSTKFGVFEEVTLKSEEPYPSIQELLPLVMLAKLPSSLVKEITERYATLGEKYLTDALHSDGRRINGMMFTDRMVNANEEVIDACFCLIGQIFKDKNAGKVPNEDREYILEGLAELYTMISVEISLGSYA